MSEKKQEPPRMISPVLSIISKNSNILSLEWNFHGLPKHRPETSQLFIFKNMRQEQAQRMVKGFYDESMYGDLIGVVALDSQRQFLKINWIQKSSFGVFVGLITQETLNCRDPRLILKSILPKFKNRRGLNMIIFVDPDQTPNNKVAKDSQYRIQDLQTIFHQWLSGNECSGTIILNMISNTVKENKINSFKCSNIFTSSIKSYLQVPKTIKKYMNAIRLSKVVLRIQNMTEEYRFRFFKSQEWDNTEINIFEKTFYNLPGIDFTEELICQFDDIPQKGQIRCLFELQLTFLDGTMCLASQQFVLCSSKNKRVHKTIHICPDDNYFGPMQLWKGEDCLINLYSHQQYLLVSKNGYKHC